MKTQRNEIAINPQGILSVVGLACLALAACAAPTPQGVVTPAGHTPVTLMLDWVPNTNHTGIFVAQAQGYFEQAGLQVQIVQPGEVYAEQAVVGGRADFGISFQEQVTLARADQVPIVSIAAIIQHNTSGFASPAALAATRPTGWEGLRYGSFGSPFEEPTLRELMECDGADFNQLEIANIGFSDPLALLDAGQIELAWIFQAWQGIQAEQQGLRLSTVMMQDWFDCIPDYYTPVVIADERQLAANPMLARAFLLALSRGYTFAIQNPVQAAEFLLEQVPELNPELVQASQAWLAPRYQAEAPRWGEQQLAVWKGYSDWMVERGILTQPINPAEAFTNDFLP